MQCDAMRKGGKKKFGSAESSVVRGAATETSAERNSEMTGTAGCRRGWVEPRMMQKKGVDHRPARGKKKKMKRTEKVWKGGDLKTKPRRGRAR